jgi:hypothetical protein
MEGEFAEGKRSISKLETVEDGDEDTVDGVIRYAGDRDKVASELLFV